MSTKTTTAVEYMLANCEGIHISITELFDCTYCKNVIHAMAEESTEADSLNAHDLHNLNHKFVEDAAYDTFDPDNGGMVRIPVLRFNNQAPQVQYRMMLEVHFGAVMIENGVEL